MGPVAAVAIPAAIEAAGTLGGAVMGGKGAKKAADTQLTATREALAFEREKEVERRRQYDIWQSNRMALLKRYGVELGDAGVSASGGTGLGVPASTGGAPSAAPVVGKPANLAQLLGGKSDLEGWNDWSTYGLA